MLRSMFVCALFVVACARGGENGSSDATGKTDASERRDSSMNSQIDGHNQADASIATDANVIVIDAFVPPVDAASAFFCTMDSQCTNAGQCCLSINGAGFCGNGVVVFGTCIPQ